MTTSAPSVRLALPRDAARIAVLQIAAATEQLGEQANALLGTDLMEDVITRWQFAITRPPLATMRVLVATQAVEGQDQPQIVGYAVTGPSDDEDADASSGIIAEFTIGEAYRRQGHGSRLLHACVDTLRADGFSHCTTWLDTTNDPLRTFLVEAGFVADGAFRELDDEPLHLRQLRLITQI
ncbi:MAG: GNAT family N-acetyltransferase [Propionibacteriaceae bacterium]